MILMFTGGGLGARLSPMVTWGRLSAGQPGASPILAGFLHYTGFNAPMQSFNTSQIVLWQSNLLTFPCPLIILFTPRPSPCQRIWKILILRAMCLKLSTIDFSLQDCSVQIAYIFALSRLLSCHQIAILLGCIEIDPHKRLSCLRQDRFSDHLQYDADHLHQSIEWSFTTLRQDISTRIFHPAHRQH